MAVGMAVDVDVAQRRHRHGRAPGWPSLDRCGIRPPDGRGGQDLDGFDLNRDAWSGCDRIEQTG
jgi:hypothetical protein